MVVADDIRPASDPANPPPYTPTEVALSDWPAEWRAAWSVFRTAELGDTVLWGSRSEPLAVQTVSQTDEGFTTLVVAGPRGGQYTLRERYDEDGTPRYYADDSKAMDLRFIERENGDAAEFSEAMYKDLLRNLKRTSVNAYVENDYSDFGAAVDAVVSSWAEDVSFQRWRGWPYEWERDTAEYIFKMVREHSGQLPEIEGASTTPKRQAIQILQLAVREEGRSMAHEKLITSQGDYDAIVEGLASDAVERDARAAHLDARQATAEVAQNFIDAHTAPVWRAIVQFSHSEIDDPELYADVEETPNPASRYDEDADKYEAVSQQDLITREMAYDLLDMDVWAQARREHEDRGTHDPTVRGLAFYEYDDLVETLVEETLREHRIGDNRMLYTTAREVVRDFADTVEAHEWPYEFGGISEGAWGAGDVEDIFSSIVMHSEVDPQVFNPFARDKERRMAVQVLSEVVHNRASNAMDARELREAPPVPADEYLDDLGLGMSFNDIRDDTGLTPEDFIREAMRGLDSEEAANLAGWTFVDELVSEGKATVPYASGPWVLVDYGLVRDNDTHRSLAWFNRNTGAVLSLAGSVSNPPSQGGYDFNEFHVALVKWQADQPHYLLSDASLGEAFKFVRSYLDADSADINVIETADGQHYIQEAITEDDIDSRPFVANLAPSFSMPGPDFSVDDALAYGGESFRRLGGYLRDNSKLVETVTRMGMALYLGEVVYMMYRVAPGLNVEPDMDKKYGVGLKATYNFGQSSKDLDEYDPSDDTHYPYTGRLEGTFRVTPGAFRMLADTYSPSWLYRSSDGTVLSTLKNRLEEPIEDATGDYGAQYRAIFLAAHLPPEARGRPADADDYPTAPDNGTGVSAKVDGQIYQTSARYKYGPGDRLSRAELREHLRDAALHGYIAEKNSKDNQYIAWEGDEDLRRRLDIDTRSNEEMLNPAELHEVGWALARDDVLYTPGLIGTAEQVAEAWKDDDGSPVCTYKTFLRIWREFYDTPNHAMLEQVWEFYKARSRDTDDFTLLDAYDRFRMGLVYDTAERETRREMAEHIRSWAAATTRADEQAMLEAFKRPGDREYVWQLQGELSASTVFDDSVSRVPVWIVFPEHNLPDADEYVFMDEDGTYFQQTASGINEYDRADRRRYHLNTTRDVMRVLTGAAKDDITEAVARGRIQVAGDDYEEGDPIPNEERKWLQADADERVQKAIEGTVRWDDLDGTDLHTFGLFLRGVDMEGAAQMSDAWRLSDRFKTRLSDVLPSTLNPTRPDIPSFEDWLERRRGRNAIGSIPDRARQKATYLKEIARDTTPSIRQSEAMGTDPEVEDEVDQLKALREHYEGTDYDLQQFYADEYGESFDDVAMKFNEQRPVEGTLAAEQGDSSRPDTAEDYVEPDLDEN